MRPNVTTFHFSVALLLCLLLAEAAIYAGAYQLVTRFQNYPVGPGPEFQANRLQALRECQELGKQLAVFRNRGVGQDWLDRTVLLLRGKSRTQQSGRFIVRDELATDAEDTMWPRQSLTR